MIEWLKLVGTFLFDRNVRLRLRGYQPVVLCIVRASNEPNKYLLVVPSANRSVWTPPQEKIGVDDSIRDAARRCLEDELTLKPNKIHFLRSCWIDKRVLPHERQYDDVDLTYSLRRRRGVGVVIGKAYYGALLTADEKVKLRLNPAEVHDAAWVGAEEFKRRIGTNLQDKRDIIVKAWDGLVSGG